MDEQITGQLQINSQGEIVTKVDMAIKRLQAFEPEDGYFLAFSGGKDSQCIYHLAKMAEVKFDAHYSVTSVDPPELVKFIKEQYPDVHRDIPHYANGDPINMWSLIEEHILPPTRMVRYCCEDLKECNGKGRLTVTGVRWAESPRRKVVHDVVDFHQKKKGTQKIAERLGADYKLNKNGEVILNDDNDVNRRMVEHCFRTRKTIVNPIVDWTDDDVWNFLNENNIPHCSLYDEGMKRLGCIGCPLAGPKQMMKDFARWPKYRDLYMKAFVRMARKSMDKIVILKDKNITPEEAARQLWNWWMKFEEEEGE